MTIEILSRVHANAKTIVERVFEGDTISVTLAAFEYSYQADEFAKLMSRQDKDSDCAYMVRGLGRTYADEAYSAGKKCKRDHWAHDLKWSDNAK